MAFLPPHIESVFIGVYRKLESTENKVSSEDYNILCFILFSIVLYLYIYMQLRIKYNRLKRKRRKQNNKQNCFLKNSLFYHECILWWNRSWNE